MSILVTGGLGYIGSHVVRVLEASGSEVVIVDDYSTGKAGSRPEDAIRLDVSSPRAQEILTAHMKLRRVTAVIHLAGRKDVAESIADPLRYYQQNVDSVINVLGAMVQSEVSDLVFSSSAAVYGAVDVPLVLESQPLLPINPYGASKNMGERIIQDAAAAYGIKAIALRYFNVGGAGWPDLGDTGVSNLIPRVFDQFDSRRPAIVFGDDYDTRDGTCERDYIHVLDLAEAHQAALGYVRRMTGSFDTFNVGTGTGSTVREVIDGVSLATGASYGYQVIDRREGDPPTVVADVSKMARLVGWTSERDLIDIIRSAKDARLMNGI